MKKRIQRRFIEDKRTHKEKTSCKPDDKGYLQYKYHLGWTKLWKTGKNTRKTYPRRELRGQRESDITPPFN